MLKVTKTLTAFLFMSLAILATSCSKDEDNNNGSTSAATVTYEVNGELVSATKGTGIENVNCTYSQDINEFWLYGIDKIITNPSTGLPGYENRIDLKISNVEDLNDLVGQTIEYSFGATNGMNFTPLYGVATPSEIILTSCKSGSVKVTSVSGNKITGIFSANFGPLSNQTVDYQITNGKFTNVPILLY